MKRILTILSILFAGALAFGWIRAREQSATRISEQLQQQQVEWRSNLETAQAEQKAARAAIKEPKRPATARASDSPSPAVVEWLAAGDFSSIPPSLVPEVRTLLGLAEDTGSDYVLISKPTMETLRPPSPGKKDTLSDGLCALLSIGPGQRSKIQMALTDARKEFANWGRENVVRETPGEEAVVRYTLPAGSDFADALTNRLMSSISNEIGVERSSLFRTYAETWFQIEMGYLGGVTNTLSVLKKPDDNGEQALYYKLTRQGANSSMSEGPGKIVPDLFPPAWRNVFPGGWPEVAEREGLELPVVAKRTGR